MKFASLFYYSAYFCTNIDFAVLDLIGYVRLFFIYGFYRYAYTEYIIIMLSTFLFLT